jgi:flagellar biosynthesis/type III secretory pathway protein FliH
MCKAQGLILSTGREGRKEGRKEGKREGRKEGRGEGREEGRKKKKRKRRAWLKLLSAFLASTMALSLNRNAAVGKEGSFRAILNT